MRLACVAVRHVLNLVKVSELAGLLFIFTVKALIKAPNTICKGALFWCEKYYFRHLGGALFREASSN